MRGPFLAGGALALAAACSSLGDGNDAVAIEVVIPSPASIEVDDTIQLRARLLDQNGDSIGGTIRWRTLDTATVGVDSINGRIWGRAIGTGRVQAMSGSLIGPATSYSVRARADTLIIAAGSDSLFVTTGDTATVGLSPKVATAALAGVQDATLILTMLLPADSSALLSGNVKADTLHTGASGTPAVTIRVRPTTGTRPDSAIVQVEARRPSGAVVAGSGQKIRVFFQ